MSGQHDMLHAEGHDAVLLLVPVSQDIQQHDSACTMGLHMRVMPEKCPENIWVPPGVCKTEDSSGVIPHPKLF